MQRESLDRWRNRPQRLSDRHRRALWLIAQGFTLRQVAEQVGLSLGRLRNLSGSVAARSYLESCRVVASRQRRAAGLLFALGYSRESARRLLLGPPSARNEALIGKLAEFNPQSVAECVRAIELLDDAPLI